ncbi:MAG: type II toxin-antitoxin system prevent-host-death family antitoxin [Acidimicrobiales bacterium]
MARQRTTSAALRCSFCGKQADEVEQLIAGGARAGTFICDQCLEVADDIRAEHLAEPPAGLASIGIRELRSQVAALVRRAAAGERLIVTVDGRPMAQLGPIEPAGAPQLEDLAAAGLVEPPRAPTPGAAPEPEDLPVDVRLDRVIDDLRGR